MNVPMTIMCCLFICLGPSHSKDREVYSVLLNSVGLLEFSIYPITQRRHSLHLDTDFVPSPKVHPMDEEELSMQREMAALIWLRDMRNLVPAMGSVYSHGLSNKNNDNDASSEPLGPCTRTILRALQEIFKISTFAVKLKLETFLGDEMTMPILLRLRKEILYRANKEDEMDVAPVPIITPVVVLNQQHLLHPIVLLDIGYLIARQL